MRTATASASGHRRTQPAKGRAEERLDGSVLRSQMRDTRLFQITPRPSACAKFSTRHPCIPQTVCAMGTLVDPLRVEVASQ